jgi:transcriptional regulator with XRE-family HTH domain
MNQTFTERIRKVIEAAESRGYSVKAIAKACGISNKAVYQWISGDSQSIKGIPLVELADLSGYSAKWIATGKGKKFGLSEDEELVLTGFGLMGEELRASWITLAESYIKSADDKTKAA